MAVKSRPLSPHLQIYRLPLVAVLSICHRISGVLLTIGSVFLVYWLLTLASGPEAYAATQELFSTWAVKSMLLLWSFALYFHLFNGIRHLFWDAGYGFDLPTADASGTAVLVATVLASVATWAIGFGYLGGVI